MQFMLTIQVFMVVKVETKKKELNKKENNENVPTKHKQFPHLLANKLANELFLTDHFRIVSRIHYFLSLFLIHYSFVLFCFFLFILLKL